MILKVSSKVSIVSKYMDKMDVASFESESKGSTPEVFLEKYVLKIWSKFTGGHPCPRVISIKFHFGMSVL